MGKFCPLVLKIVQRGMTYKQGKSRIFREDIDRLNLLLGKLSYKIPELHDDEFLHRLPHSGSARDSAQNTSFSKSTIAGLEAQLTALRREPENRGFKFERFLTDLFAHFGLAPRGSFRLTGEQIDGSLKFHGDVYLMEAKWQAQPIGNSELLVFSGKVSGKAEWTRGLLVSYSGFSQDGLQAFSRGRQTNVVCMSGIDLRCIVLGKLSLVDVLDRKVRHAAETNDAFAPVQRLFPQAGAVL